MSKNYLVTGGCGFIGSYVVEELLKKPDVYIYNIDKLGIGSDKNNIVNDPRVKNQFFDIANEEHWRMHMENPFEWISKDLDYVIHLAAESHVDRSISDPLAFINSNIVGTAKVLEIARQHSARMVHVSTDEVYGHLTAKQPPFKETDPLKPRSPYAASKASSDLLVQSYCTTYNLNASITRCCNNYGPRQHSEKLIPTIIRSIVTGQKIPVYGNGENIREWVHASDHAKAIIEVAHKNVKNEIYNITGSLTINNLDLIKLIIKEIEQKYCQFKRDKFEDYIEFVTDRKGHDFKYELQSKHKLKAVKKQLPFSLDDTLKFFVSAFTGVVTDEDIEIDFD
tara:strand:- start:768 stop:1781 length:1014 start_codon:yes stop_codon:yes gene_type:complete